MDNNNTEWRETPAMMLQGLLRNRLKFKFFSKSSFFSIERYMYGMGKLYRQEVL